MGGTHVEEREDPARYAPERAVADHFHEVGEGPVAAPAAAHQVQWLALEQRQVQVGRGPRGDAGDDQPASRLEGEQVLLPHIGAHAVEYQVNALAVCEFFDPLAEPGGLAVVDHLVRAPFLCQ